jgi:hypothetical protein
MPTLTRDGLPAPPCPACEAVKGVFTYPDLHERFYFCPNCELTWSVVRGAKTKAAGDV